MKQVQDDCIAVALGLPELMIVGQLELDDHSEFTIRYGRDKVGCPLCCSTIARKHDSTFQREKDRKSRDKIVVLSLGARRFRCLCCGEVFTEPDHIFGPKRSWTKRLRKYLGERAGHQTVVTFLEGHLIRMEFSAISTSSRFTLVFFQM